MPSLSPSRPSSPAASRLVRRLLGLVGIAVFGGAWDYFIVAFGWSGALLGWWPAAVIGGGGALTILQGIEFLKPARS